jgi:hypothetical protein
MSYKSCARLQRSSKQAERWGSGYDSIGENRIRTEPHGGDYVIKDVPEVDVSVSEEIAPVNLRDRRNGIYLSASDLTAHDEHWTRRAVVGTTSAILMGAPELGESGDDGVVPSVDRRVLEGLNQRGKPLVEGVEQIGQHIFLFAMGVKPPVF